MLDTQNGAGECSERTVYVEPSPMERLKSKRDALMERLDETNRAIRALESYPELQGMVELVRKASR